MNRTEKILAVAVVVLLVTNGVMLYRKDLKPGNNVSGDDIREKVKSVFREQNQDVTVETVSKQTDSLYKVILNDGNQLQKLYVTADGYYMTQNPVNISEYRSEVGRRTDFIECLEKKQVRIYSDSERNATLQQFRVFGGTRGLENIYTELNNQTKNYFVEKGVKKIPVTVYNGTIYEGVKTREFFTDEIGCEY